MTLLKFKHRNKSLSGDISSNPGLFRVNQPSGNNEWDFFKAGGLHFIHINVNSLLPQIDELRRISCLSNSAVIEISELDKLRQN